MKKFTGWFEGKTKQMVTTQGIFQQVILFKQAHWAIAAAARIGQIFQDFSGQLYTAPIPAPPKTPDGHHRGRVQGDLLQRLLRRHDRQGRAARGQGHRGPAHLPRQVDARSRGSTSGRLCARWSSTRSSRVSIRSRRRFAPSRATRPAIDQAPDRHGDQVDVAHVPFVRSLVSRCWRRLRLRARPWPPDRRGEGEGGDEGRLRQAHGKLEEAKKSAAEKARPTSRRHRQELETKKCVQLRRRLRRLRQEVQVGRGRTTTPASLYSTCGNDQKKAEAM